MKTGFPWHVKGVRQRARETAREAARRSGLSVGEWLDSLISESALSADLARRAPASDDAHRSEPRSTKRIPGFDDPPQPRRALGPGRPNGLPAHEHFTNVSSRLDSLSRELDERERRAAAAEMSAVNSRLDAIARQLDQRQMRSPAEGIVTFRERLDTLAHRQADGRIPEADLGAVKERLDTLAQQFEQRQNRVPDGDLDKVKERLDTLAQTLDQRQSQALEAGLTAVKNHVDSLAQKLDQRQSQMLDRGLTTVRDRLDKLASQLEQQHKLVPDEHLAAVNERLDLMVLAVDQLARTTAPGAVAGNPARSAQQQREVAEAELAAVKERLDALASQLDQRQSRIPDDHLALVKDQLDTLALQLDQQQQSRLPDKDLAAVNERLDALVTAVDQLVRVNAAGVDRSPVGQPADDSARDLAEAIARLDLRLDQLISEGRSATSEIEQRVSAVDRAVAELNRVGQRPALADPATPLDQALFEITERQRALDGEGGAANGAWSRAATQDLAELREQLRGITAKFETMRPCGIESAVDTLRNDLAEIGLMIKEAMPRKAIEALENEVRSLSERIGEGRQAGAAAADIAGLERGLAEVRDALRTLTPAESLVGFEEAVTALSHRIDTLTVSPQDPATLDQLEAAIAALRGIVAHVASNDALAKLGEDVRALADKIDQLGTSDALSILEQRITAIADVMHTHNQASQDAHALANVVEGLTDKLEKIQLTRSDQTVVGHLEDRIVKLVEKLDACDGRLVHLETIERGLAELLIHLEHQRLPAVARAGAGEAPEVDTLKREVRQTQDSVEGMHNVLDHLVDRLASLESGVRQGALKSPAVAAPSIAPASSEPAPPAQPALQPRALRPAVPPQPASDLSAATLAPGNPLPANDRERRPIDPTLPPDHPIEPGSGARARSSSAAERIAASEAALGAAKPPVIPDPAGKSNFIAAARRAAKAALAEAPARADKRAPAAAGAAGAAAPIAGDSPLAGRISKRVRALLVATSVVLIVLGSLHFAVNLFSASEDPAPAPATPATPAARSEEPATATPPGRQSAISPNAPGLTFGLPGIGATMPAPPRAAQVPVPPNSPAQPADGVITGTVRVLDAPAAARATSADKLPAAIGNAALRAAANKGDPTAEFEIAVRFAEGRGVPQDFAAAAEWFERAAKGGLVPAQFRLGGLYEKGLGVTKDLDKARRLYLGAAEAGNAKAMHNLAVLHSEGGFDGKPDFAAAAKWFRKAADYGVGDSQYNLGILYARGIGVEANLVEAYRWFALAAREGDADSGKKRDEIGARIDQQALMSVRAATQVWSPASQPELAVDVKAPAGGWDAAALPRAPTPAPAVRRVGPKAEVRPDAKADSKTDAKASARTDFKTDFKLELPPYLAQ